MEWKKQKRISKRDSILEKQRSLRITRLAKILGIVGGWFLFYSYKLQLKLGDKECKNTLVEEAITLRRAIQIRSRESMINTDTKKKVERG